MVVRCRRVTQVRKLDVIFPNPWHSVQLWSNFASYLTELPRRYAPSDQMSLETSKPAPRRVQTGPEIKRGVIRNTVWWYHAPGAHT